jgi:iron-sulfur cluster assembly protein
MLTITNEAADAIRELVETNDLPAGGGMRITATEEDDGVSIELDLTDGPETADEVVESGGARVFLDETASETLSEVELSVTPHGDHVHFEFNERGDGAGEGA